MKSCDAEPLPSVSLGRLAMRNAEVSTVDLAFRPDLVELRLALTVQKAVGDGEELIVFRRLVRRASIATADGMATEVMRIAADAMAHEVEEFLEIDGVRVFEPHKEDA